MIAKQGRAHMLAQRTQKGICQSVTKSHLATKSQHAYNQLVNTYLSIGKRETHFKVTSFLYPHSVGTLAMSAMIYFNKNVLITNTIPDNLEESYFC